MDSTLVEGGVNGLVVAVGLLKADWMKGFGRSPWGNLHVCACLRFCVEGEGTGGDKKKMATSLKQDMKKFKNEFYEEMKGQMREELMAELMGDINKQMARLAPDKRDDEAFNVKFPYCYRHLLLMALREETGDGGGRERERERAGERECCQ